MMDSIVTDLAIALIDIESVSGNEKAMADFLQKYLETRGWRVIRQGVYKGRDNVYAHRPGRTPKLILNSHIDTVPPFFGASRDENWLRGRGACDTKSLIAAQLLAVEALLAQGREDVGLLYVVGEEVDHCGMIKANELELDPAYLIVGEPTESKLIRRQKGLLKFRLEARGVTAHSGYPHTGVSAVDPMLEVLYDLRHASWPKDEYLGETTLNIGLIGGGRAANVVPDQAFAEVLIRVVTTRREIEEKVKGIVGDRVHMTVIAANDPQELHTLAGYPTDVVAFNTDIPYFHFGGKPFLWGAGSIQDAHTAGEKIGVRELEAAVGTYQNLMIQCLGAVPEEN